MTHWNIAGLPCDTEKDLKRTLLHLGHWDKGNGPRPDDVDLDAIDINSEYFKNAIRSFQDFEGIEPDGEFGNVSHTHMKQRFCGQPDFAGTYENEEAVRINGTRPFPQACRSPLTVSYHIGQLPGMNGSDSKAACSRAMADISRRCGMTLEFSAAHSNINVNLESFPGGTLAMAMLCTGSCSRGHTLRMDSSNRRWSSQLAQAVFVHEFMHNLGYYHSNKRGQIMYPSTNGSPFELQSEDIERLQAWYGRPVDTPDPPSPGPAPAPVPVPREWTIESQSATSIVLRRKVTGTGGRPGGGNPWNIGG